ncbi:hypothetical protein OUZ56_012501 [Daphnia magna]|uniref:Uncharacterized protein n=1 Tax=Daphnia magna TaxID=35525 RepID=A0ABQ9Z360_9CRUS|nr:hypothetical protein OUZ56_012501 [Daphnia magna]
MVGVLLEQRLPQLSVFFNTRMLCNSKVSGEREKQVLPLVYLKLTSDTRYGVCLYTGKNSNNGYCRYRPPRRLCLEAPLAAYTKLIDSL